MISGDRAGDVTLVHLHHMLVRCIDRRYYTLTIKQLVVLLTCFVLDEDHTVKKLSARLRIAKPVISHILNHLVEEGLMERRTDPRDRRSVLFEHTYAGKVFLKDLAKAAPGASAMARLRRLGR